MAEEVMKVDDEHWRICVERAGVDNWSGYEDAMEYYNEEEES